VVVVVVSPLVGDGIVVPFVSDLFGRGQSIHILIQNGKQFIINIFDIFFYLLDWLH